MTRTDKQASSQPEQNKQQPQGKSIPDSQTMEIKIKLQLKAKTNIGGPMTSNILI